jgi:MerR family transcriptional regulator, heat shock protein HspR
MTNVPTPEAAVYVISVAAELTGLHPQTLRTYERLGLVTPGRSGGGGRRYSFRDVELLREIASLTSHGIGLEGVRRILELEHRIEALQHRNAELQAELETARSTARPPLPEQPGLSGRLPNRLPARLEPPPSQSMVVWRRGR